MKAYFSEAAMEIKKTRTLTGAALTSAATVVLDFFRIVVTQSFEISFSFLGIMLAGMLYGPIVGGMVGGISDILEYLIRPSGAFFFGFTLNKIIAGFIFGLFLYKKNISIKRLALALLVENVIVILILTPIWLNMLYGTSLFVWARVVRCIILFPVKVVAMSILCKAVSSVRLKSRAV